MTISKVATVVTTKWLREKLGSQAKNTLSRELRVLDTSFSKDKTIDNYKEAYLKEHIPQSMYFNLHHCVQSTPEIPRNLPDPACFAEYAQQLGVWPDTHIVAYDRFGPLSAFRTWWTFRLFGHRNISVLDGGFKKWVADAFEVTDKEPTVEKSDFVASFDKSLLRNYHEMVENTKCRSEQVVDGRANDDETVVNEELDGGVIPGAQHVSFEAFFNEDGTIKSRPELKAMFEDAGIDVGKPMVSSCLSGMMASGVAGAAHILDKDIPIYYGSWTEWKQRAPKEIKWRRTG